MFRKGVVNGTGGGNSNSNSNNNAVLGFAAFVIVLGRVWGVYVGCQGIGWRIFCVSVG